MWYMNAGTDAFKRPHLVCHHWRKWYFSYVENKHWHTGSFYSNKSYTCKMYILSFFYHWNLRSEALKYYEIEWGLTVSYSVFKNVRLSGFWLSEIKLNAACTIIMNVSTAIVTWLLKVYLAPSFNYRRVILSGNNKTNLKKCKRSSAKLLF